MERQALEYNFVAFPRKRRLHTALTKEQAVEIFMYKVKLGNEGSFLVNQGCRSLATYYKVHEKTIRDIWSGRTWRYETMKLAINICKDQCPMDAYGCLKNQNKLLFGNVKSWCAPHCKICCPSHLKYFEHNSDPFYSDWLEFKSKFCNLDDWSTTP